MKAFTLDSFDAAPGLRDDLPEPTGERIVRVQATSVNPVDGAIAAGMLKGMAEYSFPVILGRDFAGPSRAPTRRSSGSSRTPTPTSPPARGPSGSPSARTSRPSRTSLSMAEAGAAPLAGITALLCVEALGLSGGERVLIVGATGGVGSFAVQFASRLGATVIAPALAEDRDYLEALGASEVPERGSTSAADAVIDLVSYSPDQLAANAPGLTEGGKRVSALGAGEINVMAISDPEAPARLARTIDEHVDPGPDRTLVRLRRTRPGARRARLAQARKAVRRRVTRATVRRATKVEGHGESERPRRRTAPRESRGGAPVYRAAVELYKLQQLRGMQEQSSTRLPGSVRRVEREGQRATARLHARSRACSSSAPRSSSSRRSERGRSVTTGSQPGSSVTPGAKDPREHERARRCDRVIRDTPAEQLLGALDAVGDRVLTHEELLGHGASRCPRRQGTRARSRAAAMARRGNRWSLEGRARAGSRSPAAEPSAPARHWARPALSGQQPAAHTGERPGPSPMSSHVPTYWPGDTIRFQRQRPFRARHLDRNCRPHSGGPRDRDHGSRARRRPRGAQRRPAHPQCHVVPTYSY